MSKTVAVLITCHNRRETTLRCLERLSHQILLSEVVLEVFLVDDASSDGTAESVRSRYPNVHLIEGTGDLYWTGGTLLAERHAQELDPDFLLWLNDDVVLEDDAIEMLVAVSARYADQAIVVGSTNEPGSSRASYGGLVRRHRSRPLGLTLLDPDGTDQRADTMNGNAVLVPRSIRANLGPLDERLVHNAADHDYGFRAGARGIPVVVAPAFVGECAFNDSRSRWLDPAVPLRDRWRFLMSFRGLPPAQWLIYTRRHCGWRWPRWFLSPYIHCLLVSVSTRRSR